MSAPEAFGPSAIGPASLGGVEARAVDAADGRKAATQARILTAAMHLFADHGFSGTPISRIAERAGVSRAAVFWHFGNKQTLFEETCRHFLIPFRQAVETPRDHLPPRARVIEQVEAYERFVGANQTTMHAFVRWVFAEREHAAALRDELLSLHAAFTKNLREAMTAALGDEARAGEWTALVVSALHGNMLLALGSAPEATPITRSAWLRRMLDRVLP